MKLNERQKAILKLVREKESVEVETLAVSFDVTTQTIRRDVNQLCELGLLRRLHGGVCLPSAASNISFESRQTINSMAKWQIAHAMANRIPNDCSVFLGIGTTMEYLARELLGHSQLTVLTNNLNVAAVLSGNDHINVLVSGGMLRSKDKDLVGEHTLSFIRSFTVDYGVVGAGSLDEKKGIMDFDVREAAVSQTILSNARQRILLADSSKWDRSALAHVAGFEHVDVFITDQLPQEWQPPGNLKIVETEQT